MGLNIETQNVSQAKKMKKTTKTITIAPTMFKKNNKVIVLPQNKTTATKSLLLITNNAGESKYLKKYKLIKKGNYSTKPDSTYGSGSESEESIVEKPKIVVKKPRLHMSEKLMRRRLKNKQAAQNARDKKRAKMEEMEAEVQRLKAHAKSLQVKNAQLINENLKLKSESDEKIKIEQAKIADFIKIEAKDDDMIKLEAKMDEFDFSHDIKLDDHDLFDIDFKSHFVDENNNNDHLSSENDPFFSSVNAIFENELINTFGDLFPDLPTNFNTLLESHLKG